MNIVANCLESLSRDDILVKPKQLGGRSLGDFLNPMIHSEIFSMLWTETSPDIHQIINIEVCNAEVCNGVYEPAVDYDPTGRVTWTYTDISQREFKIVWDTTMQSWVIS